MIFGANLKGAAEDECWDGLDDGALLLLLLFLLLLRAPKIPLHVLLLPASCSAAPL